MASILLVMTMMRLIQVFTFLASLKIWNRKRLNCVASLMSQIVIRIVMMIMMTIAVILKCMIALLTITIAMKVMVRQQLRMGAVSSQLEETQKVEERETLSCAAKCFPRNN